MGGGGGTQQNFKGAQTLSPDQLGQASPGLFNPYQQHMPAAYFGSAPINDPTSIINAYMQNMPAFLQASKTENTYKPAAIKPSAQTAEFAKRLNGRNS